jgi:hypothetical protein
LRLMSRSTAVAASDRSVTNALRMPVYRDGE